MVSHANFLKQGYTIGFGGLVLCLFLIVWSATELDQENVDVVEAYIVIGVASVFLLFTLSFLLGMFLNKTFLVKIFRIFLIVLISLYAIITSIFIVVVVFANPSEDVVLLIAKYGAALGFTIYGLWITNGVIAAIQAERDGNVENYNLV